MAVLEIRKYPDPILRQKTKPVSPKEPGLKKLVEDMLDTMYAAEGVGLAANQVGRTERVAVIDVSGPEDKERTRRFVLINPEIVALEGDVEEDEGCLSFPGIRGKSKRALWAKVRALDLSGKEITVEGDGLLGKALQHELDHLDGKLFIDKLGLAQKALLSGKLKEMRAEAKEAAGAPKPKRRAKARR